MNFDKKYLGLDCENDYESVGEKKTLSLQTFAIFCLRLYSSLREEILDLHGRTCCYFRSVEHRQNKTEKGTRMLGP